MVGSELFPYCRACRRLDDAGALLRVTPHDGSRPYAVHRPEADMRCFRSAGLASEAAIAPFDAAAAREWDRENARLNPKRAERRMFVPKGAA